MNDAQRIQELALLTKRLADHVLRLQKKVTALELKMLEGEHMVPWPAGFPLRYNACTDACDMWTGPCACGAWHKDGS